MFKILVLEGDRELNRTVKKEREKIAPEIIRLADELMK